MELVTDFAVILSDSRFSVQTVRGRYGDMRKAVERRLEKGQLWHWAIIHGEKNSHRGMMLVRPTADRFETLYLDQANCGTDKPSTKHTATVLHLLGVGRSENEVFTELQKYDSFLALNIHPNSQQRAALERLV